jgi:hypothetical protein
MEITVLFVNKEEIFMLKRETDYFRENFRCDRCLVSKAQDVYTERM